MADHVLLTAADPEPPAGTIVRDDTGCRWVRQPGRVPCGWISEHDAHGVDPESWRKVAGNYGPVVVLSMPQQSRVIEGEIRSVHGPIGDCVATAPAAAELARILTERVEAARDAIALRDSNGFPSEWLGDALLAVLKIHGGDLATLRAVAEEIGIEVDRG